MVEKPRPETVIADGFNISQVVTYPWTVNATSDQQDTLVVRQSSSTDVTVQMDFSRGPGQRSVALSGYVQVTAQGTQNTTISSVQVCA